LGCLRKSILTAEGNHVGNELESLIRGGKELWETRTKVARRKAESNEAQRIPKVLKNP
jgi:hypothetical protein